VLEVAFFFVNQIPKVFEEGFVVLSETTLTRMALDIP